MSSANLSVGFAPVSRRTSFQVPLMISFWSSASLLGLLGVALLRSLLLVLGRALGGLLALAEDLLEVADLGEEHVARGPPRLAVGSDVLGPEEVGDELVGRGLERLEVEQMLGAELLAAAWSRRSGRSRRAPRPPWCS